MNFVFRKAQSADVASIVSLVNSAYRGESSKKGWTTEADYLDGQRTDPEDIQHRINPIHEHFILLCLDQNQLIASVYLQKKNSRTSYLGMLTVDPHCQAAGVGKKLLAQAEKAAQEVFGAQIIELTVIEQRHELIRWYERRGYKKIGERRAFPSHDPRFGLPKVEDLHFEVFQKQLL